MEAGQDKMIIEIKFIEKKTQKKRKDIKIEDIKLKHGIRNE